MNAYQKMLLARFERLLRMADDYKGDLNPIGMTLLERCIIATWIDCFDVGVEEEADRIARQIGAGKGAQA